jgi:hypothetical protein
MSTSRKNKSKTISETSAIYFDLRPLSYQLSALKLLFHHSFDIIRFVSISLRILFASA